MLMRERDPSALRSKHVYDQAKLKEIVNNYHLNKDYRYKRLPIEAIKTIRTLRLNRKGGDTDIHAKKGGMLKSFNMLLDRIQKT